MTWTQVSGAEHFFYLLISLIRWVLMMKMEYFEAHWYSWNFPIIFRSPGWCNSTVVEIFLQVFRYISIKSNQNRTEQAGTYDLLQYNQVPLLYHCAIFSYIKEKKEKVKENWGRENHCLFTERTCRTMQVADLGTMKKLLSIICFCTYT